uniref:Uncharacterized protein n=2 Tax=viral metagenome TaxID=1070528 RepID=A0A6H1Z714_9ZZZZ
MNMKKRFFSGMGLMAICFAVAIFVFQAGPVFSADFWDQPANRDIAQKLGGWTFPKVVQSGTTQISVNVIESEVVRLDLGSITAGCSIFLNGESSVPTHSYIVWNGTGNHIYYNTSGADPLQFSTSTGGWPFPKTSTSSYTYVLEVMSGMWDRNETSGDTVYVLSGVTIQ